MDVQGILNRIEERLKNIGMPKEEFYKLSGISSATYSYWNTGRYKPTPKKLRPAADVLGVSYLYLLTGEEQKNNPASYGEVDAATKELRDIWESSDDSEREMLLEMARLLKKRRAK